MTNPPGAIRICRDRDDDVLIETAILAGASVIVTRDDDLKGDEGVRRFLYAQGIEVLTVAQFLARLDESLGLQSR